MLYEVITANEVTLTAYLRTPVIRVSLLVQFGIDTVATVGTLDKPVSVRELLPLVVLGATATIEYLLHPLPRSVTA